MITGKISSKNVSRVASMRQALRRLKKDIMATVLFMYKIGYLIGYIQIVSNYL